MIRKGFVLPWCLLPGLLLTSCSPQSDFPTSANGDSQSGDLGGQWPTTEDASSEEAPTGAGDTQTVRARFFHGIPNLGILSVCHDPDYVADDPDTNASELDLGPLPATPIAVTLLYAYKRKHETLASLKRGAMMFYGGAQPTDGGADADCNSANLEAILPLPFDVRSLGLDGADDALDQLETKGDAGTSPLEELGIRDTFAGPYPVTVFGSGLAFDPKGLDAYESAARASYLAEHPGDDQAAELSGRTARAHLIATRGPKFVITEEKPLPPEAGAFTMHAAHLVVDAPSEKDSVGELRVCITEETVERAALPPRDKHGLRFRLRTALGNDFRANLSYRFRFFAREAFDTDGKGCAATSIEPIAQLKQDAGTFQSGHSYTLVVAGAISAAAIHSPKGDLPVIAAAGVRSADEIKAAVLVMDDAL